MAVYRLGEQVPLIDPSAYIADDATVIGWVTLGGGTSVWPRAVLRGDSEWIRVGRGCNIQDGAVLHADPGFPVTVADHVTVGHQAVLHGCTVGDASLIGIQAVILNGAVIGQRCLVGAGALITQGQVLPDRSLILGAPAQVVRELTEAEIADLLETARRYVARAELFKVQLGRIS